MRFIIFRVILLLITGLCFQSYLFAQEKVNMEDKIISSTFKTLAKAFILMADTDKLKKNNIEKLNKMEEEKFKRRYAKVYEAIKDLPPEVKVSYGITEHMSKERVIKDIESLDDKTIYQVIDSMPDKIIAIQFRQYLSEKEQAIEKSNLMEQISNFWSKMIGKVNMSNHQK